jgi:hypothetical protein
MVVAGSRGQMVAKDPVDFGVRSAIWAPASHAAQRILPEPHGKKFALIVNEFGEIGIDDYFLPNIWIKCE